MKKILIPLMGLFFAGALMVNAQDATPAPKHPKHELTTEQKAVQKELLEKYDTNKDGKLDKKEIAKFSKEDREKAKKAGLYQKKAHKATDKAPKDAPKDTTPSTNSPATDKK